MQIIWRTAMSLDGRIASEDESLNFLDTISDQDRSVADFPAFMASVDAIIVGAGTLRWLIAGGHGWPHGDVPTWLVSHDASLEAQVGKTIAPFRRFEGDVSSLVAAMEAAGRQRAWLAGGGNLAGQLLAIDRIDEVDLTIAPVALGAGPSLFGDQALGLRPFDLAGVRQLTSNTVALRYRRIEPTAG